MSSYAYTFHYADSGRRAMNGMYRVSEAKAIKAACELSLEKKRAITVRQHTPDWYTDQNWIIATCVNGKKL